MNEHSELNKTSLMKLYPLKGIDRYRHPMQHDFEYKDPKTSENKVYLPVMDFLSGPEIPAFMANYERHAYQKNQNFLKEMFERRLERGNEEELKQLLMPKPPRKTQHCGVCLQYFEDYKSHVTAISHIERLRGHPFLQQLFNEMEKVHGGFLKDRQKYATQASPLEESLSLSEDGDALFEEGKAVRNEDKKHDHLLYQSAEELDDKGERDSCEFQTAKKVVRTAHRTTKKKDSKTISCDQTQRSENHNEIRNKENEGNNDLNENIKYRGNPALDKENPISNDYNLRKEENNDISSNDQPKRIYVKLKTQEVQKERSRMFAWDKSERKTCATPETDQGFYQYPSCISTNMEESKSSTTTQSLFKDEKIEDEFRVQRRNPGTNRKRDHDKMESVVHEQDIIRSFKKVKITDSQTSSQLTQSGSVRLDFSSITSGKWNILKNSFSGLVNKICDFWKK